MSAAHQELEIATDDLSPMACVVDEAGVLLAVNEAWRRFTAIHGGADVGDSYLNLCTRAVPDESLVADAVRGVRAVLEGRLERFVVETPCPHVDGGIWVEVVATRIQRADLRGAVITHVDTTERRRAERELRESQRFLSTLISNVPGCVYRCLNARDWPMQYMSEGALQLTGYPPDRFQAPGGPSFGDLTHPDDRERIWQEVQAALDEKKPFELVYRLRHVSGEWRWVWERGRGVFSAAGALEHLEGFITDITERIRLEERLKDSQKMEAVGRLAGGIAHDFNNLFVVILGSASLIGDNLTPQHPARAELELIDEAAHRAAELTRQLLAFARKQMVEPRVVDLNVLVAGLEKMIRRLAGDDVELVTRLGARLWPVRVDPAQLEQVIVNLVLNARQAMPGGGRLTVETANVVVDDGDEAPDVPFGDWVRLSVRDTGHGMSEETLRHVFEPFFTTKENGEGTGLGLASCYGIVTQAGGAITASSAPSQGSTFEVYLPRAEGEPAQPAPLRPASRSETAGHEVILLVEDDPLVMKVAQLSLQVHGYTLLTATSGAEALDLVRSHPGPIDLIVSDLVMPGMSGRELSEHLLRLRPGIPMLYVSGYTEGGPDERTLLRDGVAFLPKPFTPAALSAKVREVLDRARR